MYTIAVINQKGGVGKSTTALAIGAGLILKGYKVLFIDLDSQGNLSYSLRANTEGYNSLGVLQRPETILQEIQETPEAEVIASSPALAGADTIITETGKEYRLKEALGRCNTKYDYCIIDTPPALGILTINALTACSGVIIPAQADLYSLQGIAQLSGTLQTVKRYCNPDLYIMGIVLTRFNKRSIISRDIAELAEGTAKELNTKLFKSRIRECTALKESQAVKTNIYSYAPRSNATVDYKALVEEILEEEI